MCGCKGKCGCNIISTTKGEKGDASPVASLGYKVYKALISQSGTGDPIVNVLANTLGGSVVWTRDSVGYYKGTLTGAFDKSKTYMDCANKKSVFAKESFIGITGSPDFVFINSFDTGVLSDDVLYYTPILIEVYP